jgi:hypothetical protein
MADRPTTTKLSQDDLYLKLLKGEISSEEFVKGLKDEVRGASPTRSTSASTAETCVA